MALAVCLLAGGSSASAARLKHAASLPPSESWVGAWEAGSHFAPASFAPPSISNQTVRQITFLHYGGNYVRVRFSNEFGSTLLQIGTATVGLSAGGASIDPATLQSLTFSGSTSVTIAPHAKLFSDPVAMQVAAGASLAVSYWIQKPLTVTTWHWIAEQTNYISQAGDFTKGAGSAYFPYTFYSYALVDGVDVGANAGTPAILTLGDSITDGYGSTLGANMRWPDQLAGRLQNAQMPISVMNAGIAGNRVLNDSLCYGPSALRRFATDVSTQSGARYVILLEGTNDINFARNSANVALSCVVPDQPVNAAEIIAGDEQLIADAHSAGLTIYGGTITPGSMPPSNEAIRSAVNSWIRTSNAFDGFIDFDAAVRDPSNPTQLLPAYDSGDHLHPNDAGYGAMAQAVPLTFFSANAPRHRRTLPRYQR